MRVLLAHEGDLARTVVDQAGMDLQCLWSALEFTESFDLAELRLDASHPGHQDIDFKDMLLGITGQVMAFLAPIGQTVAGRYDVIVSLTKRDLRNEDGWLFGATQIVDTVQFVGVSTYRMSPDGVDPEVLRRVVQHEFGHALGLIPNDRTKSVEEKIGLHCTNLCLMRQGMCYDAFRRLADEERREATLYCAECIRFLRSKHQ